MTRVAFVAAALVALAAIPGAQDHTWRSAQPGREVKLPADHASHADYKLEWWYYTGNLDAKDGRRFGYQLTFFRIGISRSPGEASPWSLRDLYMTHLALTDVRGRQFQFAERLNRSGPGWAGASEAGYRVWNDNWEAALDGGRHRLRAVSGAIGVDLVLDESRPPVLHGNRGYSRKGPSEGNASHYYSLTRMATRGTVWFDGQPIEVAGLSWMDHEFGTSFLEGTTKGWDWFSIQFEDGRDLMLYRFRRSDGALDPHSSGTLVTADGHAVPLSTDEFSLEPGQVWTSAATGGRYPIKWRVRVPAHGIDATVTAAVADQELHMAGSTGVNYWEGAVDIAGTASGAPLGRGYLEMTGYAGRTMGELLK